MRKKTNPRKVPRTEADCRAEYQRGLADGSLRAVTALLWTMIDAFHATPEQIQAFERELRYNLDSIRQGTCKLRDLTEAMVREYGVTLEWLEGDLEG